jgi:hypothetical protein
VVWGERGTVRYSDDDAVDVLVRAVVVSAPTPDTIAGRVILWDRAKLDQEGAATGEMTRATTCPYWARTPAPVAR